MRPIPAMLGSGVLLLAAFVESDAGTQTRVEGLVVDINDARISNATLTFTNRDHEEQTHTRYDGTYSIELRPGTYAMSVRSRGFCEIHRAAFILEESSTVHFDFQMWVCSSHGDLIHYAELPEIPRTHLKPLVQFGSTNLDGNLQRFSGPTTWDDGTRHARNYPAIFSFNLLTVEADELLYDGSSYILTAPGRVDWQAGDDSGSGTKLKIKLDGLNPKPNNQPN